MAGKTCSCGSAMGILGSIMDIGHTTGPLFSGIVAYYLGYGVSFAGAALVLVAAAIVFRFSVVRQKKGDSIAKQS
ncbi:MAG: hypothetical protein L6246_02610 [Thermodesulfovibrionales bacterium]|nr:hypothetical protein [Thermodesulfovibrionales bacterium]